MIYCVKCSPTMISVFLHWDFRSKKSADTPGVELDTITTEERFFPLGESDIDVMYTEAKTAGEAFLNYISKKTEKVVDIK